MRASAVSGFVLCLLAGCTNSTAPERSEVEKQSPVEAIESPEDSTAVPETATAPTESPVSPIETPVSPTESPVAPTETPTPVPEPEVAATEKPRSAPKAARDLLEVELVPVDLAPFGYFLTVDLPREAKVSWELNSLKIYLGDFPIDISSADDPSIYEYNNEALAKLRKVEEPFKVILDEPQLVVSGMESALGEVFSCIAIASVDDKKYTFMVHNVDKSDALVAAAAAQSMRQTEANQAAQARWLTAKDELVQLGCVYQDKRYPHFLSIRGDQVADDDLARLSDLPACGSISVASPKVTVACLEHFRKLSQLKTVIFYSDHIGGDWLSPLRDLPALEKLIISKASIADDGWDGLAKVSGLRELHIKVGVSEGCLKSVSQLPQLGWLELVNAQIDDAMLANLKLESNKDLYLYLSGNPITDAGLEHLQTFTGLDSLNLEETQVTAAGVKKLKAALPGCDIDFE